MTQAARLERLACSGKQIRLHQRGAFRQAEAPELAKYVVDQVHGKGSARWCIDCMPEWMMDRTAAVWHEYHWLRALA
jgi:hypothetical protein